MATYVALYEKYVKQAEECQHLIKQREDAIKKEVIDEHKGRRAKLEGAGHAHIANGRIATDPWIKDLTVTMDRAMARATMYGQGAILSRLSVDFE